MQKICGNFSCYRSYLSCPSDRLDGKVMLQNRIGKQTLIRYLIHNSKIIRESRTAHNLENVVRVVDEVSSEWNRSPASRQHII